MNAVAIAAAAPPQPATAHRASQSLQAEDLHFRYGNGHSAVAGVSFQFGVGVLGLLGPNGAGKSSLMRILATLTKPSSGRVEWNGVDIARQPNPLRAVLGYLPQDFGVYPALSAREFLAYLAAVKGLPQARAGERIERCLAEVGLLDQADRRLGEYSGGMRQRVGIAQALLNDPQLLIVDEPTVGLDPEERLRFRHLISDLAAERLIILSTHIVSDVEASATDLAVMQQGRLRFCGSPTALIDSARGHTFEWTVSDAESAALRGRYSISSSLRCGEGLRLRLVAEQSPCADARAVEPGLEDAYLWLLAQPERP